MAGWLISLDGIDGTGKSTQIARLADWLRGQGHHVLCVRDPGSTDVGMRLRSLLLDSELTMHRRTEAMLFMASRCEMIETVIRPALAAGSVVLSDRFLLANVVYQSVGGDVSAETLWQLGRLACDGLTPDLTLLMDLPATESMSRIERSADRMESRGTEYLEQVREAFLTQLTFSGKRGRVIDASGSVDVVEQRIRRQVETCLSPPTTQR